MEALKSRERRCAELRTQLEHLNDVVEASRALDLKGVRRQLEERLGDWQGVLQRQPVQARQILRRLLVGRLVFVSKETDAGMVYEFTGQATYGKLLKGIVPTKATLGLDRLCTIGLSGELAVKAANE